MLAYSDIFAQKQRFLFVTAHPDDLVIFFGGLIYQLRQDGKDVYTVCVTNGCRGSRDQAVSEDDLAYQRLSEEAACGRVLGIDPDKMFCLGYADGEVESNLELIGQITKYIRQFKVDLVATHEPSLQCIQTYSKQGYFVQHRDHRQIGEAVIDAVYPFSRDRSFFPEQIQAGIEPHAVYDLLLTDEQECNFEYDWSEISEIKKAAMRAHQSQFDEAKIQAVIDAFTIDGKQRERFHYLKLIW